MNRVPHLPQNAKPSGTAAPHVEQLRSTAATALEETGVTGVVTARRPLAEGAWPITGAGVGGADAGAGAGAGIDAGCAALTAGGDAGAMFTTGGGAATCELPDPTGRWLPELPPHDGCDEPGGDDAGPAGAGAGREVPLLAERWSARRAPHPRQKR